MKLPVRIVAPIVFAVACAATLLAFLWWQLTESTSALQSAKLAPTQAAMNDLAVEAETTPVDPRNQALFALRQGDLLALRGEWAGAQQQYQLAVDAGGGLPALRKLAQAQLQRRQMDQIPGTIRDMKRAGARPEDLLLLESIVALRQGELIQARNILEDGEDSPQKHYGLGLLSIVEGNHEAAQSSLHQVVAGWEPVLRSHARILLAAYEEYALFPESKNIHLITLVARALAQVQECELALPLLVQVTQAQADYRDAWVVQGYCELLTERPEQALASLEQAYSVDPQKPEIQYFMGRAYSAVEDYANAYTFFEYALANGFQPETEVRRHLAETARFKGDNLQALDHYLALINLPEATLEAYHGYVSASIAAKQPAEAHTIALQATEKFPNDAVAYELLGWAATEAGQTAEAIAAYEKALEMNPYLEGVAGRLEELRK